MVSSLVGIVLSLFGGTEIVYAKEPVAKEVLIEVVTDWTPERIQQEIKEQAEKYNVSAEVMNTVISCESMGSTTIQSYHYKDGVREDSWGLVQINLPHNPNVTKEQALDPKFAIEFLAKGLSQGHGKRWTCYRMHY